MVPEVVAPPRPDWRKRAMWAASAVIGAGIVGWGVWRLRRGSGHAYPAPDCSLIGPDGGSLAGFRYLERVTPGVDPETPLPMIVLFHSRGSRPENHAGMFYKSLGTPVRVILPEGPHELGDHRSWTSRASRTSEQAAWSSELEELGANVDRFIHAAMQCRPTVGKPIVTGSSEGGHMAYLMGSVYPDTVRGSVAVAGYLPIPLWTPGMAPTVGLHGEDDRAVPFERTQEYWTAMLDQGAPLRVQSFPDVGHSVPSRVARSWRDALSSML